MEIVADAVEVTGAHSTLLAPTSLHVNSGDLLVVTGEPHSGHTALALALSGRLKPSRGRILVDGADDPRALRRRVAIVDGPEITEPEPSVPVSTAVAEGLSIAGRRSGRSAVRTWLAAHDLTEHAGTRVENLPAAERTRLLVDLACAAKTTDALVLDTPDRHGGDPRSWYELAKREARRQRAVVVLCSPHTADRLAVPHARVGADNRAEEGAR
ncbi:ATP-binding cassette domain-containing protein [Saccharopolyspora gregorii]|uniref:ABC transporter ATP-binding protein n=1 Tax=Saccharopolyspora gregorii TaxID=33914 RepID=A0ABP6RTY4_9PSEU